VNLLELFGAMFLIEAVVFSLLWTLNAGPFDREDDTNILIDKLNGLSESQRERVWAIVNEGHDPDLPGSGDMA
jgi:nitrogen fixation-related uncharacterized protein